MNLVAKVNFFITEQLNKQFGMMHWQLAAILLQYMSYTKFRFLG